MTTPQQKIGSGFGAKTTASQVLAGLDLSGRLTLVTGGYSGIRRPASDPVGRLSSPPNTWATTPS